MTSKHEHRFCSGSSTWRSGSCLQMPSSCLLLKAPKWAKSKLKSVEQNVPYLASSAAKYYKKGALNPLAASAASPDYLKFNVLFKIFGGLVPGFLSLVHGLLSLVSGFDSWLSNLAVFLCQLCVWICLLCVWICQLGVWICLLVARDHTSSLFESLLWRSYVCIRVTVLQECSLFKSAVTLLFDTCVPFLPSQKFADKSAVSAACLESTQF